LRLKVYDDKIYFTLYDSHQIYVTTLEGKEIKTFGKQFTTLLSGGKGEGEFYSPWGLTVDEKFLYICDRVNHRIQILKRENGMFISQWGAKGQEDGQLNYPIDLSLYDDLLYVSDDYGVQVFTKKGIFVKVIGTGRKRGYGEGEFNETSGLCLVKNKLYVADCLNNRIQVFV